MDTILSISGVLIGLLSVFVTWHYSTKERRLAKKIEEHKKQINQIKDYTKGTGYKNILRDGFHSLSYVGSVSLFAFSVQTIFSVFNAPELMKLFIQLFSAAIYAGASGILWLNFKMLGKTYIPEEYISELEEKIDKIESKNMK